MGRKERRIEKRRGREELLSKKILSTGDGK
jgi:hypothetical protein